MACVLVSVTSEDIATGEVCNANYCAVARALLRALPGRRVAVWGERVDIDGRPHRLPPVARRFVRDYDARLIGERIEFGAFDFELELPDEVYPPCGAAD